MPSNAAVQCSVFVLTLGLAWFGPAALLPAGGQAQAKPLESRRAGNEAAPGALIDVRMNSRVGVVLDEVPHHLRGSLAAYYLKQPRQFWKDRAIAQIRHTNYRLTYRQFFYEDADPPKAMLALPPQSLWRIDLKAGPVRIRTRDGHDAVVVDYAFTSTLLSDPETPGQSEPALRRVGGVWEEPFQLPLDPEFVFQRTGYACVDEDGYPLRTADSENLAQLFDQTCDVEAPDEAVCHLSEFPEESCSQALRRHVGRIDTNLRFERVRYERRRASTVRVAEYTQDSAPDLAVIAQGLETNRIVYRYIEPDSCAVEESCVSGSGWRRLLMYDASIKNASSVELTIGPVTDDSPFVQHNVFEFSACHEHYHYSHYGDFRYGSTRGDKRAFCIESTDRYYNSEQTPLAHPYGCDNQGIASGWGDTYIAGVECNWIDITDLNIPAAGTTQTLEFVLNPDNFICEGAPVTNAAGEQLFTPTTEIGENGAVIDRPLCEFIPGYTDNNLGQRQVSVPRDGGLITGQCTRNQAGPLRDCGFRERAENLSCTPGEEVLLRCRVDAAGSAAAATQVLRVCENSAELGGVTACMYRDALATAVVGSSWTDVTFSCPVARDGAETGGGFGYFTAPVLPNEANRAVTCQLAR